jgi:type I restriction enzyme S subunit
MSLIEDLISELCPDGVPRSELNQFASYSGTRVSKDQVAGSAFVGVETLLQNQKGKRSGVLSDKAPNSLTAYRPGDVLVGNIRPYLQKIWLADVSGGASGDVLVIRPKDSEELYGPYLYFALARVQFFDWATQFSRGAGMPRGDKSAIMKFSIQVPPLPVQIEVANILNNFRELGAELEAELEARRNQYEFYRDQLLTFPDDDGVRWLPMGEVFDLRTGYTPSTSDQKNWEGADLPWIRIEDIHRYGRRLSTSLKFVNSKVLKGSGAFTANSLLISTSATVGEYALVTVPHLSNQRFASLERKESMSEAIADEYLLHLGFLIAKGAKEGASNAGNFPSISNDKLKRILIPVPNFEAQREVAVKLDAFDALVNDISFGLPAEIAARRKQYEYYRDKLLTFPEKGSA